MTGAIGPAAEFLLAVAGWSALQFLWQGAAVGLAIEAVLAGLRNAAPRLRERVAWLGLFAMVLVFAATGTRVLRQAVDGGIVMTMAADRAALGSAASAPAAPDPMTAAAAWVGAAWLAAAEMLVAGIAVAWWRTRRLRSRQTSPLGGPLAEAGRALSNRMGIRGEVRLLVSRAVEMPVLAGWGSPAVLLPGRMVDDLPHESALSVIAHELAHVRRGDALARIVQRVLAAMLFFHPSVHRLLAVVDQERERSCDDLAVLACGSPLLYARALARLERLRPEAPGLTMAADGTPLLARIRRLLDPQAPPPRLRRRAIVAGGGALALGLAALAAAAAPAGHLAPRARQTIAALRSNHRPAHAADLHHAGNRLQLRQKDVWRIRTTPPRARPAKHDASESGP